MKEESGKPVLNLYFLSIQAIQRVERESGEIIITEAEHEISASYAVSIEDACRKGLRKAKKRWSPKDGWSHSIRAAEFDLSGKLIKESDVRFVE